jgi:hypothetical protein
LEHRKDEGTSEEEIIRFIKDRLSGDIRQQSPICRVVALIRLQSMGNSLIQFI